MISRTNRQWLIALVRDGFGRSFWWFLAFAIVMGVVCHQLLGPQAFQAALQEDIQLLAGMLPRVIAALTVAGMVWVLLPRERFSRLIGKESGMRGLVIATAAGIITPGGPASAYPLLAVMGGAGADRGALIAYITSWAILGVQRILIWDLPFMGADFSLMRFLICLPLPILAGLIARWLPLPLSLLEERPAQSVLKSSAKASGKGVSDP
ncbi:MAG: hypothetical protein ABJM11_02100 [Marinobacter sp.]|uniref:Permease n=1 Tax=Marinobacter algicola DG893 TaxID=443152 RepID=A6F022_9GAMM|nr:hypothetical protein [Marinobacter algicola]EDM47935.1 hypothetical protein MDG893_15135 [Marinobacter algicola DG893]